MRVLKKYVNRRLYDTETSSYIKLEDVQQLVVRFQPIQVIDIATNEDITEQILLSVITNIESKKTHQKVLTRTLLEQLIRMYSYDYTASSPLGQYLENALKFYEEGMVAVTKPLDSMQSFFTAPYEMWQKAFTRAMMPNKVHEEEKPEQSNPDLTNPKHNKAQPAQSTTPSSSNKPISELASDKKPE